MNKGKTGQQAQLGLKEAILPWAPNRKGPLVRGPGKHSYAASKLGDTNKEEHVDIFVLRRSSSVVDAHDGCSAHASGPLLRKTGHLPSQGDHGLVCAAQSALSGHVDHEAVLLWVGRLDACLTVVKVLLWARVLTCLMSRQTSLKNFSATAPVDVSGTLL
eukprot:scaffold38489_cov19-Tisochrysis_lutea.AAC.1